MEERHPGILQTPGVQLVGTQSRNRVVERLIAVGCTLTGSDGVRVRLSSTRHPTPDSRKDHLLSGLDEVGDFPDSGPPSTSSQEEEGRVVRSLGGGKMTHPLRRLRTSSLSGKMGFCEKSTHTKRESSQQLVVPESDQKIRSILWYTTLRHKTRPEAAKAE